ncbi:UNVERIFIED_CONTAM: protein TOPLESS-RELATED PROTEIN 2 [Sesamum calycinum]|uniref:Protein TOPLESS-RELATED PROTEIN 2 n=1 Tax=Sesamum calycinum TaxID=2727403 RepID=A0AAW2LZ53_9LAMI
MSSLSRELVFLILQFLDEEKFKETVHKLEQESGFFFNMKYFEDQVQAGEWDDVERYLSGFTKVEDNRYSMKIFFEIRKQKYLEALDSLNWQHQLCKNPRPNPDIKTLFTDHTCASSNGTRVGPPTNAPLAGPVPKPGVFPPLGGHGPFQSVVSPPPSAIAGWMSSPNPPMPHAAVAAAPPGLVQAPSSAPFLKHPRTPPLAGPGMEYQTADSEHLMKRLRAGQPDEVSFSGSTHAPNIYSPDDLPKTVVRSLSQGSNVMSLDFHPQQQTVLLVGTNVGDISIWEVGSRERLALKTFKVWEISACSMPFQTTLVKDATISVNRCVWGPDGSILGVAFSKHIVQIYTYNPAGELRQHLEVDAHTGGVNDIAFAHPNKQLCIVTCGDDKTIKVWDAVAGRRLYTFEGHEAPVYSVCPHYKENIQQLMGKIKAWLYDSLGSRVDYDAPGLWCTTMAYSADGTRLFSCGTSKKIKFWDMDNTNMLTYTDADGGLPASPRLRFNKEGSLLAVTTSDNGIKVLANGDGQRMLRMLETRSLDGARGLSEAVNVKPAIAGALGPIANVSASASPAVDRSDRIQQPMSLGNLATMESSRAADVKPRILDTTDKLKSWKLPEISDSSQLKTLKLPDPLVASKSSASSVPQLWQPNNGALMSNDLNDAKPNDDSVASTYLAFHPQDNNIIAIGMEDSTIQIYNVRVDEVKTKLKGHQTRITGLAFSQSLNILVSSGADAQLCVWSIDGWEKKKSRPIQAPPGHPTPLVGETRVQFHNNQLHLLVVHESQIAVCDAQLECLRSWYPRDSLSAPISSAIYSCDGLSIFTGFCDGAIGIFDADSLSLRCRIAPSAYISSSLSSNGGAFPVVIAAHPSDPNQFALGMSDGAVHVVEPSDGETKWGGSTSQDNGAVPSIPSSSALNSQPSETPSR